MLKRLLSVSLPVCVCAGVLVSTPAVADPLNPIDCSEFPDASECEVRAEFTEETVESTDGDHSDGSEASSGGDAESETPNCFSEIVDISGDAGWYGGAYAGERPSEDHVLLGTRCQSSDLFETSARWVILDEDDEDEPLMTPEELAMEAVDQLRLPQPNIASSPAGIHLVHLPTWLWVDDPSWEIQRAEATIPGLSVTASATPVVAHWETGDGSTVTCEGQGTPWTEGTPAEDSSPDCGHTYTRSTASAPGGEYAVTVTVTWEIEWSGGGESGTVPDMTTSSATSWPVAESQSIIR